MMVASLSCQPICLLSLSDEYLEPVPAEDTESDSGKFVLKHGRKISTSKSKYDKPSKLFSKSNYIL